ncbi:MAG: LapA family protein [Rhodoferax sp.]|nr:LapA family protein [Rhodoferax sp.]
MKHLARFAKWMLKAAIFFTLFAFALNNQHDVTVHFFFGRQWTAPLVLVVLSAFAIGLVIGVLGMVPRWWQHRRTAVLARKAATTTAAALEPEKPPAPPPLYGI